MNIKTFIGISLPFFIIICFIIPLAIDIPSHSSNSVQVLPEDSFKSIDLTNTPINIIGNVQLASWSSAGDGSRRNPYIIENYNIDCTSNITGVSIQNTNMYFILRKINVSNCVDGFYFDRVSFGSITNSYATNNSDNGVLLAGPSSNNILMNNVAVNNINYGFELESLSIKNTLIDNVATQNGNGFYLVDSSDNSLSNNTATQNGNTGIYTTENLGYGFWILTSSNNSLTNNLAAQNNGDGFSLTSSSNNSLSNNLATQNGNGFSLTGSFYNILLHNTATSNIDHGFYVTKYVYFPLPPVSSFNNTLSYNSAYNDSIGYEIFSSYSNMFFNNSAMYNNLYGFELDSSSNNTLISNTGQHNHIYDYYEVSSLNNVLTNNLFGNSVIPNTTSAPSPSSIDIIGFIILSIIILIGIGLVVFVSLKGKSINTFLDAKKNFEYNNQLNKISNVTVCPTCGSEVLPDDQYCINCGVKLKI